MSISSLPTLKVDADFALNLTPEISIENFSQPELMLPDISSNSKIGAIKLLIDRLHKCGFINDKLNFLQAVLARETLQSTILTNLVALPHARSRSVNRLGLALGIAPTPVDFPSGDACRPIRIICLLAVPARAPDLYLAVLSRLAGNFRSENFVEGLLGLSTPEQIFDHLIEAPSIAQL